MKPDLFRPLDLQSAEPPPLSDYGWRFLGEGDSWFSIGTLAIPASNLPRELQLGRSTAIVNCAHPGDTLQHIVDCVNDPNFDALLRGRKLQRFWEAILFSAGGNDLIDAAQHRAVNADGSPAPLDARLLLTPAEAAAVNPGVSGAARFVSNPGWTLLAGYLRANLAEIVRRREQGDSRGRPLLLHTYQVPVVRPAGTLGAPKGWLFPAMVAYGIPPAERQALTVVLFERLRQLLLSVDASVPGTGLPQVHVYDSAHLVALTPAQPGSSGDSGDWANEIHPNRGGYIKIGQRMGPWVDEVLAQYP